MKRTSIPAIAAATVVPCGCRTDAQILAKEQDMARDTALRRGQFELNYPQATATVLSSVMLQPITWRGTERAEYTVGVSGCGQQKTWVVHLPARHLGLVRRRRPLIDIPIGPLGNGCGCRRSSCSRNEAAAPAPAGLNRAFASGHHGSGGGLADLTPAVEQPYCNARTRTVTSRRP